MTEPGEGQLPGRGNASPEWLYSFPPVGGNEVSFFHERKREVTVIQKAVANKPSHEKTKKQELPTAAEKETIGGNVQNERREKNTAAISMVTVAIAAI